MVFVDIQLYSYVLVFEHTIQLQNHKNWLTVYRKNHLKRRKNLILFNVSLHKFDDQFLLRSDTIYLAYFLAVIFGLVQCWIFMGLKEFVSIGVSFRSHVLLNLLNGKLRVSLLRIERELLNEGFDFVTHRNGVLMCP